jgi:PadR family transcriptional regulator AphA
MRLTSTSYAVLGLVDLLEEATPYDLKRAIEQSIENFWPVPHTTFYVEPARLAKGGYLSERQEAGGRRRKHYALTEAGREALRAWVATPEVAPPELHDEFLLKIFLGADPSGLVGQRRAWHEAKLAELEGYLRDHALSAKPGVRLSLEKGIAYHCHLLVAIEDPGAER